MRSRVSDSDPATPSESISPTQTTLIHPDDPNFPWTTPAENTGVAYEDFDDVLTNAINQEAELRRASPFKESRFSITYDYATDYFYVTLNDPKTQAFETFTEWRRANYSLVAEERFMIK